jgi:hypothetical protein
MLTQSDFLAFSSGDLTRIEQRQKSATRVYARIAYQWEGPQHTSRKGLATGLKQELRSLFDDVASNFPDPKYKLDFSPLRAEAGRYLLRRILLDLFSADLVFFDLTYLNPNVFFELGIAYSLSRRVLLLIREDMRHKVPSDMQGLTLTTYSDEDDFWFDSSTRSDLKSHIRNVIKEKRSHNR